MREWQTRIQLYELLSFGARNKVGGRVIGQGVMGNQPEGSSVLSAVMTPGFLSTVCEWK